MLVNLNGEEYDLSKLTNIYESILVYDGEDGVTAISKEFYTLNSDKLEKMGYCLNFMFGNQRVDVNFESQPELESYSQNIITLLQTLKK